jgi:hypothetical protein
MFSIALLALWTLVSGVVGVVYDRKRYRPVPATLNSAAPGGAGLGLGGRANVSVAGPFNEISFSFAMTSDAHTVDGAGAGLIARAFMQLNINSTKRGLLAQMDTMTLYALSSVLFNTAAYTDTVGGGAETGVMLLPLGVDADESVTIDVTFGNAVDMCSTGDLGAAGCTAVVVNLTVELLPHNPETYWAYRSAALGNAGGAIAAGAGQIQQPTPPVVPGFCLAKEVFITQPTNRTTACALTLTYLRLTQADDVIYEHTNTLVLQNMNTSVKGFVARNGYLLCEHTPLQNNDTTLLTIVGAAAGGVAIIAPSCMLWVYQAGQVSSGGNYVTPPAANNPAAASGAPAMPSRSQKIDKNKGFAGRLFGRR